jgi:hypothetical protein
MSTSAFLSSRKCPAAPASTTVAMDGLALPERQSHLQKDKNAEVSL